MEIVATMIGIAMVIHNVMNSINASAASEINISKAWDSAAIKTAIAIL